MKQVKFLLLAAFVAMFTGCQNEEIMEQDSEKDESVIHVSSSKARGCWKPQPALQTEGLILPGGMPPEQDCMTDAKMFLLKPILMQDMR